MNKKVKILIFIAIIVVIAVGVVFAKKYLNNNSDVPVNGEEGVKEEIKKEVKKLKIVDETSKSRPYAVMINNNHAAWPQCGVQDAYLVY